MFWVLLGLNVPEVGSRVLKCADGVCIIPSVIYDTFNIPFKIDFFLKKAVEFCFFSIPCVFEIPEDERERVC